MEWIFGIASLLNIGSGILAWIAKIKWSDEYRDAKEETIRAKEESINSKNNELSAKDAEISALNERINFYKDITSDKVLAYHTQIKNELEGIIKSLQEKINELNEELGKKDETISLLMNEGDKQQEEIDKLNDDRENLNKTKEMLEEQIKSLSNQYELQESIITKFYRPNHEIYKKIEMIDVDQFVSPEVLHQVSSAFETQFTVTSGAHIGEIVDPFKE